MLGKFGEGLAAKFADSWISVAFSPAFAFWAGGSALWLRSEGVSISDIERWMRESPQSHTWAWFVVGLAVVLVSSTIVQRYDRSAVRILEGYWLPILKPIRDRLVRFRVKRLANSESIVQRVRPSIADEDSPPSDDDLLAYAKAERLLYRHPTDPARCMPTYLGNVLRAAELRSADFYGLDALVVWPRLWLVLPDNTRQELANARARLDSSAVGFVWAILFIAWSPFSPAAAPIGLLAAFAAYRGCCRHAEDFADLMMSAFDTSRTLLYDALRWPLPANPMAERASGEELTRYLWRGSSEPSPTFSESRD